MAIRSVSHLPIIGLKENQNSLILEDQNSLIFDASIINKQPHIPKQFIWPDEEKPSSIAPDLDVPLVDLAGFFSGNQEAASEASRLVQKACKKHGFFLVVNHGIDRELISKAHLFMDQFFDLPFSLKQKAQRKVGEHCGYASSFTGRFSSKLPWKETLSFGYSAEKNSSAVVEEYFRNIMGDEFSEFGYGKTQLYCASISFSFVIIIFFKEYGKESFQFSFNFTFLIGRSHHSLKRLNEETVTYYHLHLFT